MSQLILASAGTTLFHIAARYLNDATQWSRIAQINHLQDPFLSEFKTLNIPFTRIEQGPGSADQR
jgi:hypothetical protein